MINYINCNNTSKLLNLGEIVNIYFDKKGPLENFKSSADNHEFNERDKWKYSSDRMHNYVDVAIGINEASLSKVEKEIITLEENFKKESS